MSGEPRHHHGSAEQVGDAHLSGEEHGEAATGVAEDGRYLVSHAGRRLREGHALCRQSLVLGLDIVDCERKRGPPQRLRVAPRRAREVETSRAGNATIRIAHFAWYMAIGAVMVWLPAWLLTRSVAFLAGLVVASAVVSNLFIVVHDTIHRPGSHRLVEAQPWFAFLDRHHWIHHIDLGANLNFLLPLADLLFGTLRVSLSQEEQASHGSLAAAKAHQSGQGERALRTRQA